MIDTHETVASTGLDNLRLNTLRLMMSHSAALRPVAVPHHSHVASA